MKYGSINMIWTSFVKKTTISERCLDTFSQVIQYGEKKISYYTKFDCSILGGIVIIRVCRQTI